MIRKKQIGKTMKIVILCFLSAALVFSVYSTWVSYRKPLTLKHQVPIMSYNQVVNSNYQVILKPNNLYSEKTLESDKIYMANFIDKIEATFNYRFSGDKDSAVSGTYEVIALLEAYDTSIISSGNDKVKVWDKQFRLVRPTKFKYKGNRAGFVKTVPVDYNYFNQFCDAVNKAAGTSTGNVILTVKSIVVTDAVTKKGTIHEVLSPSIEIPIGPKMFQIKTKPPEKKSETLYSIKYIQDPQLKKERNFYMAASVVLLLITVLFGFATKWVVEEPDKKMLSILMKKYGDRIIETAESSMPETEKTIRVANFQNLVKVSDELVKPIFHLSSGTNTPHLFYIFDGNVRYECKVEPLTFIARKTTANAAMSMSTG